MIWFTADYHLSHKNIIPYCIRPFENTSEMDEQIIKNLREKVVADDILYFLGDLTFNPEIARQFFESFRDIKIHFIIGNHDAEEVVRVAKEFCNSVSRLKDIKIGDQPITLCHYAMRVWSKSHYNAWQLYGHSHAKLSPIGKQYDVGVDNNQFYPLSYEELIDIMRIQPDNFNFIQPKNKENEVW